MSNLNDFKSSGLIQKSELFTTGGTWTKSAKLTGGTVWITAIGGGGSGNSASPGSFVTSGGDGGEYVCGVSVDVSGTSSETVTIGSGGSLVNGGGVNTAGNAGGVTSFGALLSLSGGQGGQVSVANQVSGNTGGTYGGREDSASSGQDNVCSVGGNGGIGNQSQTGGGGGGLILDDTGVSGGTGASNSASGGNGYGAGGGSSSGNTNDSGSGADGAMLITWVETL